jgi:hypothetical protein
MLRARDSGLVEFGLNLARILAPLPTSVDTTAVGYWCTIMKELGSVVSQLEHRLPFCFLFFLFFSFFFAILNIPPPPLLHLHLYQFLFYFYLGHHPTKFGHLCGVVVVLRTVHTLVLI